MKRLSFDRGAWPLLLLALTLAPGVLLAQESGMRATIETSMGTIVVELYQDEAPRTVENFANYARRGWYDGTIFHRVLDDQIIQGGGYLPDLSEKSTDDPVVNEADNGLDNVRGTIAMARLSDPDSATSQFYINLTDNDHLNRRGRAPGYEGYTVFGRVVSGLDVADAIGDVGTQRVEGFGDDVPVEPVVITRLRVPRTASRF